MLLRADFKTHTYPEIIAAIERDQTDLLDEAIQAAELEAKGYMSRYDVELLFSAVGDERDKMLLMYLKDIATWHFLVLANPNMNIEFCGERYDNAIKALVRIQKGAVVPYGWPLRSDVEGVDTFFHVKSATRRETRY